MFSVALQSQLCCGVEHRRVDCGAGVGCAAGAGHHCRVESAGAVEPVGGGVIEVAGPNGMGCSREVATHGWSSATGSEIDHLARLEVLQHPMCRHSVRSVAFDTLCRREALRVRWQYSCEIGQQYGSEVLDWRG